MANYLIKGETLQAIAEAIRARTGRSDAIAPADFAAAISTIAPGASAYELAVLAGFVGTLEEWLESLQGVQGAPGKQGDPGEKGDPGEPGKDGHTPVRGVDYWTDEDKLAMIEDMVGAAGYRGVQFLGQSAPFDAITYGDLPAYLFCGNNSTIEMIRSLEMRGKPSSIPTSFCYRELSLQSVSIPDSVASIGGNAFYGCTGLQSVSIPDSVTSIGGSAFYGCTGLTSIHADGYVGGAYGNSSVFNNCAALKTVYFPRVITLTCGATTNGTFANCSSMEDCQLGSIGYPLTTISNSAFYNCKNKSLVITVYTSETSLATVLANIRNGATNATIVIKAASDMEYNGTTYSAGDTVLTSTP